eukprot:576784-Rhodomonas_salina.3
MLSKLFGQILAFSGDYPGYYDNPLSDPAAFDDNDQFGGLANIADVSNMAKCKLTLQFVVQCSCFQRGARLQMVLWVMFGGSDNFDRDAFFLSGWEWVWAFRGKGGAGNGAKREVLVASAGGICPSGRMTRMAVFSDTPGPTTRPTTCATPPSMPAPRTPLPCKVGLAVDIPLVFVADGVTKTVHRSVVAKEWVQARMLQVWWWKEQVVLDSAEYRGWREACICLPNHLCGFSWRAGGSIVLSGPCLSHPENVVKWAFTPTSGQHAVRTSQLGTRPDACEPYRQTHESSRWLSRVTVSCPDPRIRVVTTHP